MTPTHSTTWLLPLLVACFVSTGCSNPDSAPPDDRDAGREQHRPLVHFTPPTAWMNDPNGMVYYDGEYHLFYQYYPDDTVWGPMHWGHAVSRDLVNWEHLPIALYPDEKGYIFSGSAVVDWNNTSGFGDGDAPPLVAIFTYHDSERGRAGTRDHESQGIAYSTDRGRSWTKFDGNPVLPNPGDTQDYRDPNVFWHAPTERWVMALSVTDHVELYTSPNLRDWEFLSEFGQGIGAQGGVWECPDLFELPVGDDGERRWVLLLNINPGGPQGGSGTQYFVGDFDGTTFTLDDTFKATLDRQEAVWLDYGADNYAGVTWSDVPQEDGRRIFIGWMSNWLYAQEVPTESWRSAMTVPRSLDLIETNSGYRLRSSPVRELEALQGESAAIEGGSLSGDVRHRLPAAADVELTIAPGDADRVTVRLTNDDGEFLDVGYDASDGYYFLDRREAGDTSFSEGFAAAVQEAPRIASSDSITLRLVVDVASIEMFADGGATTMTGIFFPSTPFDSLTINAEGGDAQLVEGRVTELGSAEP